MQERANKSAKFKSDLLKTNEDIAPQSREILQTSVWWGHELANPPPSPSHNTDVCKFSQLCGAIFLLA